ncbi:SO2930 family diheme c-type cytochrome [Novosphingobium sp. ZN18A2]|uniref:SO2930 family diheme c-type cytochrome n=1 Tax=Novosphingobium sp. ZN18A2 TaxID=3079861 RepID=UPI0030CC4DAB
MKRGAIIAAAFLVAGASIAHSSERGRQRVHDTAITGSGFPAKLSDYGFFTGGAKLVPVSGVTPYRLNTPLWSDGATKLRFLYLPKGTQAKAQGDGLLDLPAGAALIKTFAFPEKGRLRLIETRVLMHRADGWLALPYKWNDDQTEATLALAGARIALTTPQGVSISYAIPNKNQCKECHALSGAVTPIGPKARNLSDAWLRAQHAAGRLNAVPAVAHRIPLWEDRANVPLADAARGYLDINCAHCHNPRGAASNSGLDLRWEQDNPVKYGIGKRPTAAGRGSGGLSFDIAPGDPDRSILLYRMESLEGGIAMPELGKASPDREGDLTVRAWIASLR